MKKNYVGGPENLSQYWYSLEPEILNANLRLRDLINRLTEEKLKNDKKS
jgi:hypothetical protein